MLLRFGVANHRSIRDYQELLLTASGREKGRLTMPVPVVDESAVPVVALYGANASGKSNLLDAMDDLRLLVSDSHKGHDGTDRIRRFPFRLDNSSPREPTRFECSFTVELEPGDSSSSDASVYDLEVEFTESEICRERLRRSVRHERRSTHTLYARETRNGGVAVEFGAQLQGENQVTANLTRPNSLFLSAAAQNNHPQLTAIHAWFSRDWCCLLSKDLLAEHIAAEMIAGSGRREWLDSLLKQAEAGVGGVELDEREIDEGDIELARRIAGFIVEQSEDGSDPGVLAGEFVDARRRRVRLLHESETGLLPLDFGSESRGTKTFLTLVLPALEALSSGDLLVIDELDSSLHPQLAQAFVSLFLRPESNPHGAQLVFSTHDVALLGSGLLDRDEIWMVDKSPQGATSLTPLSDFRLRGDVERAYRNGRLGGTPDLHTFLLDLTRSS